MEAKLVKETVEKIPQADGKFIEKTVSVELEIVNEQGAKIGEARISQGGVSVFCQNLDIAEWRAVIETTINQ